jgi:hypothetical protein
VELKQALGDRALKTRLEFDDARALPEHRESEGPRRAPRGAYNRRAPQSGTLDSSRR